MGLLDQLREEATKKQEEQRYQESVQRSKEDIYQYQLLPAMQQIYTYFKEVTEYLNILNEPIKIEDYSKNYPQFGCLVQTDYKLMTDKHGGVTKFDQLQQIMLRFYCVNPEEPYFTLEVFSQREIEQLIKFFSARKVPYEWKRESNPASKSIALFKFERKIPVVLKFVVDMEQSLIELRIDNHLNFDSFKRNYSAEDIDEAFLDSLGNYLLRKNNQFIQFDISEEERIAIRERLLQHQQNLQQEPENITTAATSTNHVANIPTAEETNKTSGLVNKLSGLFKRQG